MVEHRNFNDLMPEMDSPPLKTIPKTPIIKGLRHFSKYWSTWGPTIGPPKNDLLIKAMLVQESAKLKYDAFLLVQDLGHFILEIDNFGPSRANP